MPTDQEIDPIQATTTEEVAPPPSSTPEPSKEITEDVEELKEKLAAAEIEAKRWKGRVEKANEKKSSPVSEEDIDWKILNANRVSLVKDSYQKHLEELQELGAKLSNHLREKALELAESETGVSKATVESSDPRLPSPIIDRSGSKMPKLSETDIALGVKPETKMKYADYVEGR